MFWKKKKLPNPIKLLIICDTHNTLQNEDADEIERLSKEADAVIFAGDGNQYVMNVINPLIPQNKVFGILGNHDSENILKFYGIINIHGRVIKVNGVKIAGWGGTYRYKNKLLLSFTQKESLSFAKELPAADILISHDTSFQKHSSDDCHMGLKGISWYIRKKKPLYHIHGHLHQKYKKPGKTTQIGCFLYELIELS